MKYISSRIAFYSLLYLLVILLIFFLQFKKGASYHYKNEHLQVSGRIFTNEQKQKELLLPINITSNGLLISITAESPIIFKGKDGKIQNAKILSFKEEKNKFSLLLSDGIVLSFARNDKFIPSDQLTYESLYITCEFSKKVQEVHVPYKLTQRARIERQKDAILVQYKGRSFTFSKEQAGLFGHEESKPFIAFSKKSPSIYYQEQRYEQSNELENVMHSHFASRELYQKNLAHFRELFLLSLEKSMKDGKGEEEGIVALFSEYIRKNSYPKALSLYPSSILPKNKRTLRSSLFYGNLIESYENAEKQNEKLLALISSRVNRQDASIFAHPSWERQNLFSFLLNRGRADLIDPLFELAEKAVINEVSLYEIANILQFCIEYKSSRLFEKDCASLQKKCEAWIYRHLFAIEEKLYVSSDNEKIDTFATFYLATILIRYAEFEASEELGKIGCLLFNSLFTFTDNPSSFPAIFRIREGKKKGLIATDAKIISPATLYATFFVHALLSCHEVRLELKDVVASNGKKMFATTIASDIKMRKEKNSIFLEFYFQKGAMHYAVVEGIEPFTNIRIYETLGYKTDIRFEKYDVAGYVYDKENKRLYLKVDNRSEKEVIELIY